MIKQSRQKRILSILQREGVVDIAELSRIMPEVSRVTIRRDIADLAEAGALKRRHGGAVLPDAKILQYPRSDEFGLHFAGQQVMSVLDGVDAIILPPIASRGGEALRRQVRKRGIPFLAESAPQEGGAYLGPDNRAAARDLGRMAGAAVKGRREVTVLSICQPYLSNTLERTEGFEQGFGEACPAAAHFIRVNGQGSYKSARRVATDAFQVNEAISVVFGVNDHSALAGMDAAERMGRRVAVFAAGGESAEFLAQVCNKGPLRAVAAYFPDVVGVIAVDAVAAAITGKSMAEAVLTPYAIITAENLDEYYRQEAEGGWTLCDEAFSRLVERAAGPPPGPLNLGKTVGFMPHFPAHEWYRVMIQSMSARARRYGLQLAVSPPHQGIAAEIARLQREIAQVAVTRIKPGETVIIGEGAATLCMAEDLRRRAFSHDQAPMDITVITNALDVLHRLENAPGIKTIITSGEYQAADRCIVGPSLGALFERMRADKAFLSVGGVSPKFGLSAMDERRALAGSRFADAARRTIALADHTLIGADANHRVARIESVAEVITDDGVLPLDRQSLRAAGVEVLVAGLSDDELSPQISPQGPSRVRNNQT